jgi:hypothetical protein
MSKPEMSGQVAVILVIAACYGRGRARPPGVRKAEFEAVVHRRWCSYRYRLILSNRRPLAFRANQIPTLQVAKIDISQRYRRSSRSCRTALHVVLPPFTDGSIARVARGMPVTSGTSGPDGVGDLRYSRANVTKGGLQGKGIHE